MQFLQILQYSGVCSTHHTPSSGWMPCPLAPDRKGVAAIHQPATNQHTHDARLNRVHAWTPSCGSASGSTSDAGDGRMSTMPSAAPEMSSNIAFRMMWNGPATASSPGRPQPQPTGASFTTRVTTATLSSARNASEAARPATRARPAISQQPSTHSKPATRAASPPKILVEGGGVDHPGEIGE